MQTSNTSSEGPRLAGIATEAILESISDGVLTVDGAWRVSSFSRAAELITGVPRQDAIGRRCSDVFCASMCETECALHHTMHTGAPVVNKTAFIVNSDAKRIPISVSTALLRDQDGNIVGGAETFRDLSVIEELRKEIRGRFQVADIVTRRASMRRLMEVFPQIAASESTVLVQGKTGPGKELVARAIHGLGARRHGKVRAPSIELPHHDGRSQHGARSKLESLCAATLRHPSVAPARLHADGPRPATDSHRLPSHRLPLPKRSERAMARDLLTSHHGGARNACERP